MIVAMQEGADEALIQQVIEHLVKLGFEVHRSTGARMTVLGAVGAGIEFDIRNIEHPLFVVVVSAMVSLHDVGFARETSPITRDTNSVFPSVYARTTSARFEISW